MESTDLDQELVDILVEHDTIKKLEPVLRWICCTSNCNSTACCTKARLTLSSTVVKHVHAAVVPFLLATTNNASKDRKDRDKTGTRNTGEPQQQTISKDEFPSLPTRSQSLPSSRGDKKKTKRRIRPIQVAEPVVQNTMSPWKHGNLVHLDSSPTTTEQFPALSSKHSEVPKNKKQVARASKSTPSAHQTLVSSTTTVDGDPNRVSIVSTAATRISTPLAPTSTKASTPSAVMKNPGSPKIDNSKVAPAPIPDPDKGRANLVQLYSALMDTGWILNTLDELHVLFQCLTLESRKSETATTEQHKNISRTDLVLGQILHAPESCQKFAVQVLQRQTALLQTLARVWVPALVSSPLLRQHGLHVSAAPQSASTVTTTTTFLPRERSVQLTLPFSAPRDSRHAFSSSPSQTSLFHNREHCRDAFTHQLRSFLAMRGQLLDAQHQTRAVQSLRTAAATMVGNDLYEDNIQWFAEFFLELLLQIGTVPLQETDTELLRMVADDSKVQKLHERFSSLPQRRTRSKGRLAAANATQQDSHAAAAQHYFPGHQEFFYIFLVASNHYTFSMQLLACMASALQRNKLRRDDQCMLARFIGVLVFSPNWKSSRCGAVDALLALEAAGWPLLRSLRLDKARRTTTTTNEKEGMLWSTTIPLAVEILSMSQWDSHRWSFASYRMVVSQLRVYHVQSRRGATMMQAFLCLDYLFGQILRLDDILAHCVSSSKEVAFSQPCTEEMSYSGLEGLPITTRNQLEELGAFLSDAAEKRMADSIVPRASRKLRPSVVSVHTQKQTSNATAPFLGAIGNTNDELLLVKLQDGLFHTNPGLKELCELVARTSLKRVDARLQQQSRAAKEQSERTDDSIEASLLPLVKSTLEEHIGNSLTALGCELFTLSAIDEAVRLTMRHCSPIGLSKAKAWAVKRVEQIQQSTHRAEQKRLKAATQIKQQNVSTEGVLSAPSSLDILTLLVQRFNACSLVGSKEETATVNKQLLATLSSQLVTAVRDYAEHNSDVAAGSPLPSAFTCRAFFEATTEFGERLEPFILQQVVPTAATEEDDVNERRKQLVVHSFLDAAMELATLSLFVRSKLRRAIQTHKVVLLDALKSSPAREQWLLEQSCSASTNLNPSEESQSS